MERKERTYGSIRLDGNVWVLDAEPHVAMYAKRIFDRIKNIPGGKFTLQNTPATCRDLEWFLQRFPLESPDGKVLLRGAKDHRDKILRLNQILDTNYVPRDFVMAEPPRDYQRRAAELFLASQELLLADDVGLGKTCSAITAMTDPRTLPAVVVCKPNLQKQWQREFTKFLPAMETHIVRSTNPYPIPRGLHGRKPDVLILSYSKLYAWADTIAKWAKCVVFDEIQEVRREESQKFEAAKMLGETLPFKLGLSATPINNYGGEMYNVYQILAPGRLGSRVEFNREWCSWGDNLKDPEGFGSWLREQHLMLRRTRKDVKRELPPLTESIQEIDSDESALDKVQDAAGELARIILGQKKAAKGEAFEAGGEFDRMMRQATGIAKAPYAAAFIEMLLENGEPVIVFAWHRAVWEVLRSKLQAHRPMLYTGSEGVNEKDRAKDMFVNSETNLLFVSLRSGQGLDGLQKRCRTVVFAELDWSPGVHEQCIGRVFRDGQTDPVTAYFLVAQDGADPIMRNVLGKKKEQIEGIKDPTGNGDLKRLQEGGPDLKGLAQAVLARRKGQVNLESATDEAVSDAGESGNMPTPEEIIGRGKLA